MPSIDTQIKKGAKKTGGRPKGAPNKATTEIKAAVMAAFDKLGGAKYLITVAEENPAVFCQLLAKILPNEIKSEITINNTLADKISQARRRVAEQND